MNDKKQPVLARVKPNNNYGPHRAGEVFRATQRELDQHPNCLERADGTGYAETPRTQVVSLPAEVAQRYGFPLGRRQEGPIAFEVTRLRPDGKPQLQLREDLAGSKPVAVAQVKISVLDQPEVQELVERSRADRDLIGYIAGLMSPDEKPENPSAYVRDNIGQVFGFIKEQAERISLLQSESRESEYDLSQCEAEIAALKEQLRHGQAQESAEMRQEQKPEGKKK